MTLFSEVMDIIDFDWDHDQNLKNEGEFRNSLREFLRKALNKRDRFDGGRGVTVTSESGRGLCDIALNQHEIAIELKKDLSGKSKVDRLIGQLVLYKKEYDDIIVVFAGKTNLGTLDYFKEQLDDIRGSQGFGPRQNINYIYWDENDEEDEDNSIFGPGRRLF